MWLALKMQKNHHLLLHRNISICLIIVITVKFLAAPAEPGAAIFVTFPKRLLIIRERVCFALPIQLQEIDPSDLSNNSGYAGPL